MLTLNTILKELKNVPANRFADLHSFIRSLNSTSKKSDKERKKILSFAGSFENMSNEDYDDFVKESIKIRSDLFGRDANL